MKKQIHDDGALHGFAASPIAFISLERKQVVIQFLHYCIVFLRDNLSRQCLSMHCQLHNLMILNNLHYYQSSLIQAYVTAFMLNSRNSYTFRRNV